MAKKQRPQNITAEIQCTVAGTIWMPSTMCWKDGVKLQFGQGPWKFDGDLRDAALQLTNDGDFQSCFLVRDSSYLILTRSKKTGTGITTRKRVFDLTFFPSIADCLATEKDQQEYEEARDNYDSDDDGDEAYG